jgi:hypothetical protein
VLADVALYATVIVGALLVFVLALHLYATWTIRNVDQTNETWPESG